MLVKQRQRDGRRLWWVVLGVALALLCPLAPGVGSSPAGAESYHWGEAAIRLRHYSSLGIPTALEAPGDTSWYVSTTQTDNIDSAAVVWHRGAEVTAGTDLRISGSLTSSNENTLGALGTAMFTITAPATTTSGAFTAVVTGQYRRTQTLFQVELNGTADNGNGESTAVRVTGSGPWYPSSTAADGALYRIHEAEADMQLTLIFPGELPPPPGPKASSTIAFDGTASLPSFPCPSATPGENPCLGTFSGSEDAAFAGDNAAGLWTLNMSTPLAIDFAYSDAIQPGVPCAEGQAAGAVSINAASGQVLGAWTNRVDIPYLIKEATLSFRFSWTRVGATAVLDLADVSLWIHIQAPKGWINVIEPNSSEARAVAAFVPSLTAEHVLACQEGRSGPPISAAVVGVASIEGV